MKDRMLAGLPYIANDPDLRADALRARKLEQRYNTWPADDPAGRDGVLRELLGVCGESVAVRPPFHVDYGWRISIGSGTFVNFGGVFLDVAEIRIGADVQMGPHVQLLTPMHPLDPAERRAGWESAEPIAIGDNVWLGGRGRRVPWCHHRRRHGRRSGRGRDLGPAGGRRRRGQPRQGDSLGALTAAPGALAPRRACPVSCAPEFQAAPGVAGRQAAAVRPPPRSPPMTARP